MSTESERMRLSTSIVGNIPVGDDPSAEDDPVCVDATGNLLANKVPHRPMGSTNRGNTLRRRGIDLTRTPVIGRLVDKVLRWRAFQFLIILPNQILFWFVLATGLIGGTLLPESHQEKIIHFGSSSIIPLASSTGGSVPNLFRSALADTWLRPNFSTVITWWIWWCLVWLLMATVGRGWCAVCPFGGFAEWIQRRSLWKRRHRSVGLGLRWPRTLVRFGILPAVAAFVVLTFIEEYFNISASGDPFTTGLLVAAIIMLALVMHLVFERRTFCTYLCPLTAVFAPLGATGVIAGFRARDPDRCLTCPTKDCLRGGERGYECPWYEWPGSATSNAMCGLCSECYKACPYDNIGLYAQAPLTSVVDPGRRRGDIALAAIIVFGVVVFFTVNATFTYTNIDLWLNDLTGWAHYPNPIDYIGIIVSIVAIFSLLVILVKWAAGNGMAARAARIPSGTDAVPDGEVTSTALALNGGMTGFTGVPDNNGLVARIRGSAAKAWFIPLAYGIIPLITADLLANRTPTFLFYAPRIIQAVSDPFGRRWNLFGTAHLKAASSHLVSFTWGGHSSSALDLQLAIVGLGVVASAWSMHRIFHKELAKSSARPILGQIAAIAMVLACGVLLGWVYVAIGGLAT
ncbi:MAG: 4Fe-4S binding protein [Acidimicrobiales bacterium]